MAAHAASCKRTPMLNPARTIGPCAPVDVRPYDTSGNNQCDQFQNDFSSAGVYFNAATWSIMPSSFRVLEERLCLSRDYRHEINLVRYRPRISAHRGVSSPKLRGSEMRHAPTTDTGVEILIASVDRLINRPRDKSRKRYRTSCSVRPRRLFSHRAARLWSAGHTDFSLYTLREESLR